VANIWQYNPFEYVNVTDGESGWPALKPHDAVAVQNATVHLLVTQIPKRHMRQSMRAAISVYYTARRVEQMLFDELTKLAGKDGLLLKTWASLAFDSLSADQKRFDGSKDPVITELLPIKFDADTQKEVDKIRAQMQKQPEHNVFTTDTEHEAAKQIAQFEVMAIFKYIRFTAGGDQVINKLQEKGYWNVERLAKILTPLYHPRFWALLPFCTVNHELPPPVAYTDWHRGTRMLLHRTYCRPGGDRSGWFHDETRVCVD
jgi:hypothetical protein